MFVDNVKIYVKAGDGGAGAVSFRREKYVSHGGPDGGDGGRGGNIVFRIDQGCNTLLAFRYKHKFVASNGLPGGGAKFHGATADDLIISVPPGTLIKDAQSGKIIKDMSKAHRYQRCASNYFSVILPSRALMRSCSLMSPALISAIFVKYGPTIS